MIEPNNTTSQSKDPVQLAAPPEVAVIEPKTGPESKLFVSAGEADVGRDQYRLLHIQLAALQARAPLKRVLITSAWRGEGKTHVASNLALTIARESGQRVLLVDCDIHTPTLHRVYGIPNEYGLTDVLQNGRDGWKALRKMADLDLYILTSGSATSQPLTEAGALILKMLLDQISPLFDWVIIDSPPILVGADVPLLQKVSDGILLVVRGFQTPRELLEKAEKVVGRANIIGAVLNGVTPLKAYYKSYYGYRSSQEKPSNGKERRKNQARPTK